MTKYSSMHYVKIYDINYDDTSPVTSFQAPARRMITCVRVEVVTAWNDGAKAFEVGDEDDPNGFITDLGANLATPGIYGGDRTAWGTYIWSAAGSYQTDKIYSAAKNILATFVGVGDGGSQGKCRIYFEMCDAPPAS